MDLLHSLALIAQQHPSTPIHVELDFITDAGPVPHWEAIVVLKLDGSNEEPIIAEGAGQTAEEALVKLEETLMWVPIR